MSNTKGDSETQQCTAQECDNVFPFNEDASLCPSCQAADDAIHAEASREYYRSWHSPLAKQELAEGFAVKNSWRVK